MGRYPPDAQWNQLILLLSPTHKPFKTPTASPSFCSCWHEQRAYGNPLLNGEPLYLSLSPRHPTTQVVMTPSHRINRRTNRRRRQRRKTNRRNWWTAGGGGGRGWRGRGTQKEKENKEEEEQEKKEEEEHEEEQEEEKEEVEEEHREHSEEEQVAQD